MCFIADLNREGYSKLELSLALMREKSNGATVAQLRTICGRSDAWIYQHLALNSLVPELKKILDPNLPRSQQLSFSLGCRIARVPVDKQMEVYKKVTAINGTRLQLITAKKLVAELVPDISRGRPRPPADYVKNLEIIIPRAVADATTAGEFSDRVFDSLVENSEPEAVQFILKQIDAAVKGFGSLQAKILEARERRKRLAHATLAT